MKAELCQAISKLAFAAAAVMAVVGTLEIQIRMNRYDVRWLIVKVVAILVCLVVIGVYFN